MMKKLLLVLGILVLTVCAVDAKSMPRWRNFPLTVYLPPKVQESTIVQSAFMNWQANSKHIVRFIYKKSNVARKTSDIIIEFTKNASDEKAYSIKETYEPTLSPYQGSSGYYYRMYITIATHDKNDKPYTRRQLSAIALQAVGRGLGVPCLSGERGAMVCDDKYNVYSVTKEDYEALFNVYKKKKDKD